MQSLSVNGLSYRTRLLSQAKAAQFASCLTANPNFRQVEVHESPRSAGKFFVAYLPANNERCADMVRRAQAVQSGRAEAQAEAYEVIRDTSGRFFWVHNILSGDTYQTTVFNCDCPHYHHRCSKVAGMTCKHSGIVRIKQGAGEVREFAPVVPSATVDTYRADAARRRAAMFSPD